MFYYTRARKNFVLGWLSAQYFKHTPYFEVVSLIKLLKPMRNEHVRLHQICGMNVVCLSRIGGMNMCGGIGGIGGMNLFP